MEPKHAKGLDEAALAAEAARLTPEEPAKNDVPERPLPGKPLPEGLVNKPAGVYGHFCLDPRGNYQPRWASLKIHKQHENMPQRQYFNHNGKSWLVTVGAWVDVPPEILILLGYTEQEIISMDLEQSNLLVDRNVPKVVDRVQRFGYTAIPSA